MPRSPRIEFEGAIYHVMCRGDRREAIFQDDHDREMFLATFASACERAGWVSHAYVLMPNHYHIMLETPRAGLVDGMQWFQTTYTARFNARHHVCGHLFQGRYKAILIDPDRPDYFATVADYIHLNPVRAQLLSVDSSLAAFPWSSYPATIGAVPRPPWHETGRLLTAVGMTPRMYEAYMTRRIDEAGTDPQRAYKDAKDLRRGWILGSDDFRQDMIEKITAQTSLRRRDSYSKLETRDGDLHRARKRLDNALAVLSLTQEDILSRKRTDPEKQALVWLLRKTTLAPADWICTQLSLGHRANLSRAVRMFESAQDPQRTHLKQLMRQIQD